MCVESFYCPADEAVGLYFEEKLEQSIDLKENHIKFNDVMTVILFCAMEETFHDFHGPLQKKKLEILTLKVGMACLNGTDMIKSLEIPDCPDRRIWDLEL